MLPPRLTDTQNISTAAGCSAPHRNRRKELLQSRAPRRPPPRPAPRRAAAAPTKVPTELTSETLELTLPLPHLLPGESFVTKF